MINQRSCVAVESAIFREEWVRPLYQSYNFSQVPNTIKHLLGIPVQGLPQDCYEIDRYDSVIVFLIDGFGWQLFERYAHRYPFLTRFLTDGIVSKITSQFPSTTAPHVTCLHTGLEVGQSGVYEWFQYEPIIDTMIAPLLFSYAGDKKSDNLISSILKPNQLYPQQTLYLDLKKQGIFSAVFQSQNIAYSTYSNIVTRGAEVIPFADFQQGLKKLTGVLQRGGYFYVYLGDIDGQAHKHGSQSPEVMNAVDLCFKALEEVFMPAFETSLAKMALIVVADHGLLDIDPQQVVYLNEQISEIVPLLKKGRSGNYLTPAGSCRDYFLHILDGEEEKALKLLQDKLGEIATVLDVKKLIADGFFGSQPPSPAFTKRVGDLVILPHGNRHVWWHEKHRFDVHFNAMHGGLSRAEMESIFLFYRN